MSKSKWLSAAFGMLAASTCLIAVPTSASTAPRPGAHLSVPKLNYRARTLSNGLKVYSLRDTSTPNVAIQVWYGVGAKHDPEGLSGFAHFFEHLYSRKTENMPYEMINQLVEEAGGVRNAGTWWDYTLYWEVVPARYLERMLWSQAERMARPVIDDQVFETERNAVNQEMRERIMSRPYGGPGILNRLVIPENSLDLAPQRRPVIGSMEQLATATTADARSFHERYYGPDSAALIVSGNFDPKELNEFVEKHFAKIPKRANPAPLSIAVDEPERKQPRLALAYAPNVPSPAAVSSWKLPRSSHPDIAVVEVINAILTEGENSRLKNGLVSNRGLASQVSASLVASKEVGFYAVYAVASNGAKIEEVETALAEEFERLRRAPPTAAELQEAKNELLAQSLRARESELGRGEAIGEGLMQYGDARAADRRLSAIQNVTAADVQRVARERLATRSLLSIRYFNEDALPDGERGGWANLVPTPRFRILPPPSRQPNRLAEESVRVAPPQPDVAVATTPPAIFSRTLQSGLEVVTSKTGEVPLVSLSVAIKGGTSTDPIGKDGLAAFAAELAKTGTRTKTAEQIASELESLGATLSSEANPDGIVLSVSAPSTNIEAAGEILADIISDTVVREDDFERSRKRALDKLAITMSDPIGLANMLVHPVVYGSAPYGRVASGTAASLKSLNREDVLAHYRSWWRPDNSTVIVAGGIDPAAGAALAGRLFREWHSLGERTHPPKNVPAVSAGPKTIVVDMPGAPQAVVLVATPGPGTATPGSENLAVVSALLGGGSTSRLFEELRLKRGLSYGPGTRLLSNKDASVLTASAPTKHETAPEVVKIILDEIERLETTAALQEAVERRKASLVGFRTRASATSSGLTQVIAGLILSGLPAQEAVTYAERLQDLTPESARQALVNHSARQNASVIVVGDARSFIDELRQIRPHVRVLQPSDLEAANVL